MALEHPSNLASELEVAKSPCAQWGTECVMMSEAANQ
jgi:hypothetical protein